MEYSIFVSNSSLVLKYSDDSGWVYERIKSKSVIPINKIFFFDKKDIINYKDIVSNDDNDYPEDDIYFNLGEIINQEYILIKGNKLNINKDIIFYNYPDKFQNKWFKLKGIYFGNGSLFKFIDCQLGKDTKEIKIGNVSDCYLNWADFEEMADKLPNNYEIDTYVKSRVSTVLKQYTYVDIDYENRLDNYRKKKSLSKKVKDYSDVYDSDIAKYKYLLDEMKDMLEVQNIEKYDEEVWQNQIAKIFLLLFPQYICFFEKVHIKNSFKLDDDNNFINSKKYPDFVLVSNNGNVDVLEIKRPKKEYSLLRKGLYRDNYIPANEFSGTIMQVEKYILNLIKWGIEGEKELNKRFLNKLPDNLKLQINSPKGIMILGYKENFNAQQNRDFEIIKRKYANIVDIITYDDLINRLENTLKALEIKTKI